MPTVVEGDFEWDSAKAESNLEKHGVSFPEAATVFADPMAVYLDDGTGTGNMVVIGTSLRERLLYVVHVERGQRDRIISARRRPPRSAPSTTVEVGNEYGSKTSQQCGIGARSDTGTRSSRPKRGASHDPSCS